MLHLHKVRGTVPTGGEGLALGPADWHRRKKIIKERQRERERVCMRGAIKRESREAERGGKDRKASRREWVNALH